MSGTIVTLMCIHCGAAFEAETFGVAKAMLAAHLPCPGPQTNWCTTTAAPAAEPQAETEAEAPLVESLPPVDAAAAEEQP